MRPSSPLRTRPLKPNMLYGYRRRCGRMIFKSQEISRMAQSIQGHHPRFYCQLDSLRRKAASLGSRDAVRPLTPRITEWMQTPRLWVSRIWHFHCLFCLLLSSSRDAASLKGGPGTTLCWALEPTAGSGPGVPLEYEPISVITGK